MRHGADCTPVFRCLTSLLHKGIIGVDFTRGLSVHTCWRRGAHAAVARRRCCRQRGLAEAQRAEGKAFEAVVDAVVCTVG